ncbi:succinyl-diaminopimelate desuccinylase [Desulfurobacterium atlanticum]|uniref:Succinyl-diaminopimelate desuccinylase n=1 Tax=Desulfurobacterium atlanticum TaxID=240169 RepID=A0A238Y0X2_9BACT|nr:succinyl-diaminopimelate desuccinylase [Desulfurobacterium atlanticum]SNR64787.1 succinyldiaminopimelate desuccinylase [Desulfurobacterium atlanticum]
MEVVEILKKLIEIPSVYGNEKEIADFCEEFMKDKNPSLTVNRTGNTLLAYKKLNEGKPTIALVGHLDTVPGINEFTNKIIDGKLHGLGASDMKGGDAVILKIAGDYALKESPYNLIFLLYEKEEGPYLESGLIPLFEKFKDILKKINLAIILEPTDNTVQVGCLGVIHCGMVFKGKRAHSARPWQGENAIHKGWKLLKLLSEKKPKKYTFFGLDYYEVINATMVEFTGGRNIIPDSFTININYRFAPSKTVEEAQRELENLGKEVGVEKFEWRDLSPSGKVCLDNPILSRFIEKYNLKVEPKQAWTDVARFSQWNIDAVNFGPGQPSQAHQKNEYIELKKLKENYKILSNFLFPTK